MGRPTKCTTSLIARVEQRILNGARDEVAAGAEGIDRATHFRWMKRGAEGEEPFGDYCDAVAHARDVWEANVVAELSTSMRSSEHGDTPIGSDRMFLLKTLRKEAYSADYKAKVMDDCYSEIFDRVRAKKSEEFYRELLGCLFEEGGAEPA